MTRFALEFEFGDDYRRFADERDKRMAALGNAKSVV
jgi:hypothetical protein